MNRPPYAAINAKLAEVVEHAPSRPSWYDLWTQLDRSSSAEERLKLYQAVRDAGSLPEEAVFYLVAWQLDAITSERGETELWEMEERLEELQEGPDLAEYHELLARHNEAWEDLFVRTLEEHGEPQIAALFRHDHDRFEQLYEAGRAYFHGPLTPAWLTEFAEMVSGCITADEPMGPPRAVGGELPLRWNRRAGAVAPNKPARGRPATAGMKRTVSGRSTSTPRRSNWSERSSGRGSPSICWSCSRCSSGSKTSHETPTVMTAAGRHSSRWRGSAKDGNSTCGCSRPPRRMKIRG